MIAVMTHQPAVRRVIRQRHAAAGTLRHMTALSAQQHPAVSAAIQKQNTLFTAAQVFLKFLSQLCANQSGVSVTNLLSKICNRNLRKTMCIISLPQQEFMIRPFLCRPRRFHCWSCRTQKQHCLVAGTEIFCNIPGVVAGRILRLVAALLLLISRRPLSGSWISMSTS